MSNSLPMSECDCGGDAEMHAQGLCYHDDPDNPKNLRARLADLERERDEARSGVEHFRNSMYAVEADVRLANADRDRLAAELATAQRERDEWRVKYGQQRMNYAGAHQDYLGAVDELKEAEANLAALRLAHDQVSAALLEASGEIARLQAEVLGICERREFDCSQGQEVHTPAQAADALARTIRNRITQPAPADSGAE